jgi:hypothetical protein
MTSLTLPWLTKALFHTHCLNVFVLVLLFSFDVLLAGFFRSSNEDRTAVHDIADLAMADDGTRRRAFSGDSVHVKKQPWAEDSAKREGRPPLLRQNSGTCTQS